MNAGKAEPRADRARQGSARRLGASAPLRLCFVVVLFFLSSASITAAAPAPDPMQALGLQGPNETVEAPGFSLPDLTGKKIRLKDFRGKLVFLNFFATWCGPCREEMPGMERLFRTHRDKDLVVLGVNLQESAKAVKPFVQELKLSFPIVLDSEGAASREYGVRALPVSFLIGRDGNIVWRAIGGRDWESAKARQYFAQLVAGKK